MYQITLQSKRGTTPRLNNFVKRSKTYQQNKTAIKHMHLRFISTLLLMLLPVSFAYTQTDNMFVRPVFGLSQLSDTQGTSRSIGSVDGNADVQTGDGFNAGLGLGYYIDDALAVELYWEYRTNDSETLLPDGTLYNDGNYASNIFFANVHYFLLPDNEQSSFVPYIGAGLGWVQEIDIDLESEGQELSFSGDGELTYQVFTGLNYLVFESLSLQAEIRYQALSSVELIAESPSTGAFTGFDYNPVTLQLGLSYRF